MDIQQLKALNLESKWPRLAKLQEEVAGLEKRLREAETQVTQLRTALGPARERDLTAEAQAVRSGGKLPDPKHEADVKGKLEVAERTRDVMAHALQAAREDVGHFLAKHKAELYGDAQEARNGIAAELAEHAQEALAGFTRWSDMAYVLKDLAPAPLRPENVPAQRLTQAVAVVGMAQRDPARGDVEQMLTYLVSLASDTTQGETDAA